MKRDQAKAAIIARWDALAPDQRRTSDQAAAFAIRSTEEFLFKSSGDRYQDIMGWIAGRVGKP